MRTFVFATAILSTLAAAAPAAAQYRGDDRWDRDGYDRRDDDRRYDDRRYGSGYDRQIDGLYQRVQSLRERRAISPQEARRLEMQVRELDRIERAYSRDGLQRWERSNLEHRIYQLRRQIQSERWDGDDRRYR